MKPVTVVGGGFSGLSTAWYLCRHGLPVRLLEKSDRLGGLISTAETDHGPAETAANGILNSRRVESLFADVGLPLSLPGPAARARYIYRDRPRRWPLKAGESLGALFRLAGTLARERSLAPRPGESLADWGERVLGRAATDFLLGPAAQGIYAAPPSQLSARLVLPARDKGDRPQHRGIVAPPRGMQDLIEAMQRTLVSRGVDIRLGEEAQLEAGDGWTVICTSVADASALLRDRVPDTSRLLASVRRLSIVKLTVFLRDAGPDGFGILFPRAQGFESLGVLFNSNIFENRGELRSETWMLAGDSPGNLPWVDVSDGEIIDQVMKERARFGGFVAAPESYHLARWPDGLPLYDAQLESVLAAHRPLQGRLFLVGNYLGGIGLAKILRRADAVATELAAAVAGNR